MQTQQQEVGISAIPIQRDAVLDTDPSTVPGIFIRSAAEFDLPDALNYKVYGQWRSISSKEVVERAGRIALGLYSLGLRKGDRAAILAANSPGWTLADAGCQFAGIIDVPIYTTLAPDAVRYIIHDSEARVFFIQDRAIFEQCRAAIADCGSIEHFIFLDNGDTYTAGVISLAELEERGAELQSESPGLLDEIIDGVSPNDVATLIYTSGTTGEPKGVMLTQANLTSNVHDASEKYSFSEGDISL